MGKVDLSMYRQTRIRWRVPKPIILRVPKNKGTLDTYYRHRYACRLQSSCQWPWLPSSSLLSPIIFQTQGKQLGVLALGFDRFSRSGGKPRIVLYTVKEKSRRNWRDTQNSSKRQTSTFSFSFYFSLPFIFYFLFFLLPSLFVSLSSFLHTFFPFFSFYFLLFFFNISPFIFSWSDIFLNLSLFPIFFHLQCTCFKLVTKIFLKNILVGILQRLASNIGPILAYLQLWTYLLLTIY